MSKTETQKFCEANEQHNGRLLELLDYLEIEAAAVTDIDPDEPMNELLARLKESELTNTYTTVQAEYAQFTDAIYRFRDFLEQLHCDASWAFNQHIKGRNLTHVQTMLDGADF